MPAAGLLILRIVLATVLVAHGMHDLFGMFATAAIGPGGLSARADFMTAAGFSPASGFAVLEGTFNLAGGLLLAAGIFTRSTALALAVFKLVLLWKDAWRWGFFLNWTSVAGHGQGVEYLLLMLGMLGCLFLAGPGDWSLDGVRHRAAAVRAAGRARLRAK